MNIKKFKKELAVIILCVIGGSIGPSLFINAKYARAFTVSSFFISLVLILCYKTLSFMDTSLSNNINAKLYSVATTLLIFLPMTLFFFNKYGNIRSMFFQIDRGMGLVNFNLIIVLASTIFIYHRYRHKSNVGETIKNINIFFFLPFLVAIPIVLTFRNSEIRVLFLNIVVLYFFMKSIVDVKI